jgi:TRAP-type C4-dicarboxylate transport system substrate-binding protein
MTMTWGASEIDPRLDLSFLAYVVDNWKDAEKLFGPGGPMVDVNNDIFKDNNVVLLGVIPTDFGSVAIRKGIGRVPVNFPEDCKGIKVRVPPIPIGIQRFETWGFSPVPMPFAELYTALQLGTVDARAFGPPVEIWQMRDVIETYILTRDYFEIAFWLANKKWWEKLSKDEQNAIRTAAEDATKWSWQEAQRAGQGYIDKVKEYGIKVVELTPAQLKKAKDMLYEKEWPWAEKKLGKDLVDKVRAAQKAAGIR